MNAIENIRETLSQLNGEATIAQIKDCTGLTLAEVHSTLTEMYMAREVALFPHENGARPVDSYTASCALRLGITDHIYVWAR